MNRVKVSFLCFIICLSSVTFFVLLRIHRIYSLDDVSALLHVASQPTLTDGRCKAVNASHFRCLPNVFIIGASKSGTTSLVAYLQQLPGVHLVRRFLSAPRDRHREIHRFDRSSYVWTIPSVELHHEWASSPLVQDRADLVLHYTPHYLAAPSAPFALRDLFPQQALEEVRFIILLRDPVERMISSYWFKESARFQGGVDGGSIDHLVAEINRQRRLRSDYEQCMTHWLSPQTSSSPYSYSSSYLEVLCEMVTANHSLCHSSSTPPALNPYQSFHLFTLHPNIASSLYNRSSTQRLYYEGLEYCYGKSHFRSPALGLRHLEKSVYVDQVLRWLAVFPRNRFIFLPSNFLLRRGRAALFQLLHHLDLPRRHLFAVEQQLQAMDYSENAQRLRRPNQKSVEVERKWREDMGLYFLPGDNLLARLLLPL